MTNIPSTEDRVWAVLSHLSALAFGIGILLPVVGWAEQRRKSKYASFQCLQALGYQSLGYTIWMLFSLIVMIFVVIVMLANIDNAENQDAALGIWMNIFIFVIFGSIGLYFLLPVIAAASCVLGKDFHYPFMGNRLERYLGYDSSGNEWLIEDHEDRWVTAMGHFSVIIAIWGILAPFTAWMLQGKRSLFLKFQSLQTLVFQAGTLILYFGPIFLFLLGISIITLMALMGWTGDVRVDSSMGIVGIIFFGGSLLVFFMVILFVPLLHILGQWAGYRVLKGDDYRYPVIGRLVEKWLSRKNSASISPPGTAAGV